MHHYGDPYQYGQGLGNIFGGLIKTIIPAARSFFKSSAGKTIKDVALQTASNLASDIIQGKNVKSSAVENLKSAKKQVGDFLNKRLNASDNTTTKQPPKKKRRKNIKKKVKKVNYKYNLLQK